MVYKPSVYLVSAAVALMALQMHQVASSSLKFDPFTTCASYNIGDESFPGRGSEIIDDGNCVVTVPEDPNVPKVAAISTVSVLDTSLLSKTATAPSESVFTKVGTQVMSEKIPSAGADQDAYVETDQATSALPTSASTTSATTSRKLEWNSEDDIATLEKYFGTAMELKLKNLPTQAVYKASAWAGPNWPAYQDSINYKWNNRQPSPAEKYAKAFGLNVTKFMNRVSAQNGIDANTHRPKCTSDKQCHDAKIDTVCAKRVGKKSGYCIPTWYGICHAWAPAAILEQEPNCPVTFNGVTFQPMDIKALVTDVYYDANTSTVFTGSRYYEGDTIDKYGRHTDESFRDLNPGFFHVAATNLLGLLNTTFIIDRDAGTLVWNQPVVGFKVYEQTTMTPEKAASTFFGVDTYDWNQNATSIVYVKSRLSWINETHTDGGLVASGRNKEFTVGAYYDYLLELDSAEEIIGGEWLYESNNNHPDFLWLMTGKPPADTVTKIGLKYVDVTMLLKKAVSCSGARPSSVA